MLELATIRSTWDNCIRWNIGFYDFIEPLVHQIHYHCRQLILYAKGKVLFKRIDLTGYILTFFLQGQSRLHLSVGFFWLLADSLPWLPNRDQS